MLGLFLAEGGLDWELGELRVMCQEGRIGRGGKREGNIAPFSISYFRRKTSQLKRIRERTAGGRLGQMTLLKLDEGKSYRAVFGSGVLHGSFWSVTGICKR